MRLNVGVFLNAVAEPSKVALSTDLETYAFAIGKQTAEPVLREALALGIGNACLIESDSSMNGISHAALLARAFFRCGN